MSTAKLLSAILLIGLAACSRKQIHLPAVPDVTSGPPEYEDLRPGEMLRIVIPLLKSGAGRLTLRSERVDGTTISLSASDLIGYQTVSYFVKSKRHGRVQLRFASAELTENGVSSPMSEPSLPFSLPRKVEYIRLIYLQRLSDSDHNMAIVASKRMDDLNTLTIQLLKNPKVCTTTYDASCSWVPVGVAVLTSQGTV